MKTYLRAVLVFCAASVLASCGGGGDPPQTTMPEGIYTGTVTNSPARSVTGLVLDDGTYYVIYTVSGGPATGGFVQGTGRSFNGSFSSTDGRDISLQGLGVRAATISASYVLKQSFNGSIAYQGVAGASTFAATYDSKYELTPTLAAIVGTYTGTAGTPSGSESTTVTVSASGAFTGIGATSGCTFSGTIAPRAKGNAYNGSITFGSAPCTFANTTLAGGVYFDSINNKLYAAALTAARDNGFIFTGVKPP